MQREACRYRPDLRRLATLTPEKSDVRLWLRIKMRPSTSGYCKTFRGIGEPARELFETTQLASWKPERFDMTFLPSDAWLLLSLIYARDPADRDALRGVGDFINHAIFTADELEGGLARLVQAGHAVAADDKFCASEQVLHWYSSATDGKSRTAVHKDRERVERFLGIGGDA